MVPVCDGAGKFGSSALVPHKISIALGTYPGLLSGNPFALNIIILSVQILRFALVTLFASPVLGRVLPHLLNSLVPIIRGTTA